MVQASWRKFEDEWVVRVEGTTENLEGQVVTVERRNGPDQETKLAERIGALIPTNRGNSVFALYRLAPKDEQPKRQKKGRTRQSDEMEELAALVASQGQEISGLQQRVIKLEEEVSDLVNERELEQSLG